MRTLSLRPRFSRRKLIVSATALLVATGGSTAFAWLSASGTGGGSATVGSGPNAGQFIVYGEMPTVSSPVSFDTEIPLHGSFTNKYKGKVAVEKVTVTITDILTGPGGSPVADTECSKAEGADFVLKPAVPATPFQVSAATNTTWGSGTWTGASITFRNDPSRDQHGCLGKYLILQYDAVNK
jgi:hypothetical protein